eukprot:CAMPEP_0119407892 /NCGR_PEP_ID=MMETSP1335-20130426/1625_1 /TAXON_ID=259385 /ORGANISM="Chrysoculter rhomboideus, Strain RCC1486" /LENGTH=73 /DNA_ID=CAMNT_0007432055 /DNA_START=455 /DNA_END=676 /DNA_ORIENTATION=-
MDLDSIKAHFAPAEWVGSTTDESPPWRSPSARSASSTDEFASTALAEFKDSAAAQGLPRVKQDAESASTALVP